MPEAVNRLVSIKQQSYVNSSKLFQENPQHMAVFVLLCTVCHNGGVVKRGTLSLLVEVALLTEQQCYPV